MLKVKSMHTLSLVAAVAFLFVAQAPLQASQSDNTIEKSAKKTYVFKTYLKADQIKLKSKEGVVTLTGTVSEASHKAIAEETALSLPEVKSVNNQLTVTGPSKGAGSDAELCDRVRGTLGFHRSTSAAKTEVSAVNGTVTLKGNASSEKQKQSAEDHANQVGGVTGVDNRMVVTAPGTDTPDASNPKLDDASVTAQVRMSELYHHGANVYDTQVSTLGGVVTLSGTAANQTEIDLATKRVADIHGVMRVNNQMTVAEPVQTSTN